VARLDVDGKLIAKFIFKEHCVKHGLLRSIYRASENTILTLVSRRSNNLNVIFCCCMSSFLTWLSWTSSARFCFLFGIKVNKIGSKLSRRKSHSPSFCQCCILQAVWILPRKLAEPVTVIPVVGVSGLNFGRDSGYSEVFS
jgi:hypothetical protein